GLRCGRSPASLAIDDEQPEASGEGDRIDGAHSVQHKTIGSAEPRRGRSRHYVDKLGAANDRAVVKLLGVESDAELARDRGELLGARLATRGVDQPRAANRPSSMIDFQYVCRRARSGGPTAGGC